ncbi:ATP synthase F0 subunit B [Streptomyces gobiensis]|uniref:ATP synthase F0 subunit B n=1 Tax=Streptomyces gobiensis TaxID=2875706 RepID=UPI001E409779|nr:ATP synthase F0 subunit B [Streptomyces gobiensis]UGY93811.1 ATP synthase F0 subunit B [Streptomyces gobiensis]
MDVQQRLDDIVAAVESARSMPMSASCVVNRAELLAMLGEVREALPGSLAQAQELLGGREQMVAEAQQEAQRIIEAAQTERGSLVSGTEIARRSQEEADRILTEARREAAEIRAEADDYVDSKLANFEVVLSKTIGSVDRGREKLLGRGPGADAYEDGYAGDAPERTADPAALRERADAYVETQFRAIEAVLSKTLEAVGRGRQKLTGHQPVDELGAHMAAQDGGQEGHHQPRTSDADYLADLATTQAPTAQAQHVEHFDQSVQPSPDPYAVAAGYQQGAYPQQDAYAYQQQDPYYAQQQTQHVQDPYGYQQGYQQPDAYYGQQHQPQQPQQPQQQQAGALDETSLFDTSMIDIDQLREYEQGR